MIVCTCSILHSTDCLNKRIDSLEEYITSRYAAKLRDREGLAHVLFESYRYPFKWEHISFKNARKYRAMSAALIRWMEE